MSETQRNKEKLHHLLSIASLNAILLLFVSLVLVIVGICCFLLFEDGEKNVERKWKNYEKWNFFVAFLEDFRRYCW
jgi:hypothetical protein